MGTMLLTALALLAGPAPEDWMRVTSTPEGVVIYLDRDTIRPGQTVIVATERHDYSAVTNAPYREMRVQTAYDCSAHTRQVRAATIVRPNGVSENITFSDRESSVDPIQPKTISAMIFKEVCGG